MHLLCTNDSYCQYPRRGPTRLSQLQGSGWGGGSKLNPFEGSGLLQIAAEDSRDSVPSQHRTEVTRQWSRPEEMAPAGLGLALKGGCVEIQVLVSRDGERVGQARGRKQEPLRESKILDWEKHVEEDGNP